MFIFLREYNRDESVVGGKQTKILDHVHVSVTVCPNVSPYKKAKAFINEAPSNLTKVMLNYMGDIKKNVIH